MLLEGRMCPLKAALTAFVISLGAVMLGVVAQPMTKAELEHRQNPEDAAR